MSGPAQPNGEAAPNVIPGRSAHRQATWYRLLAGIAALLIVMTIAVTCIDVVGR